MAEKVPGSGALNNKSPRIPGLKIGLIGSCPPPYGGVTVHVQRLMKKLDEYAIDYVLYDVVGEQREQKDTRIIRIRHPKLWILKYFFSGTSEIIHNHTTDWRGQVLVGLMGLLGKKTVSTLHSERLIKSWKDYNVIKRKIIQIALQSTTSLIVVNAHIREFCISLGVNPDRVFLIPAFIPPEPEEREIQEIPQKIRDFIDTHDPLISANAFKIKFFKNEDVYGIDLCIELCSRLKQKRDTVGFVFFLPQTGDHALFQRSAAEAHRFASPGQFFVCNRTVSILPVIAEKQCIYHGQQIRMVTQSRCGKRCISAYPQWQAMSLPGLKGRSCLKTGISMTSPERYRICWITTRIISKK